MSTSMSTVLAEGDDSGGSIDPSAMALLVKMSAHAQKHER